MRQTLVRKKLKENRIFMDFLIRTKAIKKTGLRTEKSKLNRLNAFGDTSAINH